MNRLALILIALSIVGIPFNNLVLDWFAQSCYAQASPEVISEPEEASASTLSLYDNLVVHVELPNQETTNLTDYKVYDVKDGQFSQVLTSGSFLEERPGFDVDHLDSTEQIKDVDIQDGIMKECKKYGIAVDVENQDRPVEFTVQGKMKLE